LFNNFTDAQPIYETVVEFLGDDKTCNKCGKHFEKHWELNKHKNYCRKPKTNRNLLKQGEAWPCDFCPEKFPSGWRLRRHALERHTNREVRARFEKSIQEWVPAKELTRFRDKIV
jgi:hypothetical protein